MMRQVLFATGLMVAWLTCLRAEAAPVRVVVWDEQQPAQKKAYTNFLGNEIAEYLRGQPGLTVRSVRLDDTKQGLGEDVLEQCDVLVWWGHVRHREIKPAVGRKLVERIKQGKLSLIALHSAHWSTPFIEAMNERAVDDALARLTPEQRKTARVVRISPLGYTVPRRQDPLTPTVRQRTEGSGTVVLEVVLPICCFPAYRADGKPSHIRTLLPRHPIATGLPEKFDLPNTEMYDEPFHVPPPDEVIFEERWDAGEHFRSGCVWRLGRGRVFYFRPGHETFGVYRRPEPLKVIENAVRWLAAEQQESVKAEASLTVDVWPAKAPGETGDIGEEKVLPSRPGEKPVKRISNVTRPTLTLFRPVKDRDTGAAVVIAPGGGYNILAWDLEGEEVARWLNSIGVTGIVLKYRVPRRPGTPKDAPPPQALMDAQRAVRVVRSKAKEWGLDPKRIGMLGFSAGGHLTAWTAMNYDRRTYEPLDEVDTLSCRPDFAVLIYPAYLVDKDRDELSPSMRVTKETPPIFFVHASNDGVRPENSVLLYLALKKARVPAQLHVYASGGHGFGLRPSDQPCSTWPQRCAEWMKAQELLKPSSR
jgi:trehalose utilization protein/dienelactone hydrolase